MTLLQTIFDLGLPAWAFVAMKATVAILIAFSAGSLARKARASFRHAILTSLFALLLLLPWAPKMAPAFPVTVRPPVVIDTRQPAQPSSVHVVRSRVVERGEWRPSFVDLYVAGVALMLASLTIGIARLARLGKRAAMWSEGMRIAVEVSAESGIRRAVFVALSDEIDVPMTLGFRRQTILMPSSAEHWDANALRRALRHELEHVRREDWLLQIGARVACALYWPHPLVWGALRRFCVEAERACDDAVVRTFDASAYATQLVSLARDMRNRTHVPALAMASPTRLSERVHAILDPGQRRGPHGKVAGLATVTAMAAMLLLFGSVRLVAAAIDDENGRGQRQHANRAEASADLASGFTSAIHSEYAIKAAERGDIDAMRQILDAGLDIDRSFHGDGTLLLIAARAGQRDAVEFLLDRGADPNTPSPGDGNALIVAAEHGRMEIVEMLLDDGARIDDVVPGDENALMTAAAAGQLDVVRLLVARGADVNLGVWADGGDGRKHEWRTPLIMARRGRHDDVAQFLIAAGAR
jgi:beta-lactamase regulating signal transducer with metallopeptidase domain